MKMREKTLREVIRQSLDEMALSQYVSNVPTETDEFKNIYPSKGGYKSLVKRQLERFPLPVNVVFDLSLGQRFGDEGVATGIGGKDYSPGADQGNVIIVPGNRVDDLMSMDTDAGRSYSDHMFRETGERPGPSDFNILRLGTDYSFSVQSGYNSSAYMVFHELFDSGPFVGYSLALQNMLYRYLKALSESIGEQMSNPPAKKGRKETSVIDDLIAKTSAGNDDPAITDLSQTLSYMNPWVDKVIKDKLFGPRVKTVRRGETEGDPRESCNEALAVSLLRQTDTVTDYNPSNDPELQEILDEMHRLMSEVPGLADKLAGKLYVALGS